MRRKRLVRLLRKLRAMRHSLPARDPLLRRIGAAKTDAGRAFGCVHLDVPSPQQPVTRESFRFRVDKAKLHAAELRDGHYLLRSHLTAEDPAVRWTHTRDRPGKTGHDSNDRCLHSHHGRPLADSAPLHATGH